MNGWYSFLPVGDQGGCIDLVVSPDGVSVKRVQCKYTEVKHPESLKKGLTVWQVDLRRRSGQFGDRITKYEINDFDLLFIATPEFDYLIEWDEFVQHYGKVPSLIVLGRKLSRWKIAC